MDKIYGFPWLIGDIDESIIFIIKDGDKQVASYLIKEIIANGIEKGQIRFANIQDLTNFLNHTTVRFADSHDEASIIDIPLRKLAILYSKINEIISTKPVGLVELPELEAFCISKEAQIKHGYTIYAYKVNPPSEDLETIMRIANIFPSLSMNEKIDALEVINKINYQRNQQNN